MKKILIRVLSVGFISFLTGCATPLWTKGGAVASQTEQIDFPEVGSIATTGLGDTLATKGYKITTPGIRILEKWDLQGEKTLWAKPIPWVNQDTTSTELVVYSNSKTGETASCYNLSYELPKFNQSSSASIFCRQRDGTFFYPLNGTPYANEPNYEEINIVNVNSPSYLQEFIYNGRVGDALKFIYREFSGDYLKPAFTQEVQYDLSSSNEIGFKKLRINVVSATNTEVVYKLINNF
jgi:hypothetical protein